MTPAAKRTGEHEKTLREFEKAVIERSGNEDETYEFTLYITGMTERSRAAVENVKKLCEENLKGRYELEIIDLYQQIGKAKEAQIIAAPTLLKKLPPPLKKFIGDMSSTERILVGLNIKPKK